ncbi:MAG: DUF1971 domain-containing protein [Rhizobiales bacterium]|nr:DUF1971 domain-containing protein [Hyphomicrobiales bacterium]
MFDQDNLPAGLRREHRTKAGVWALIHVVEGRLRYRILDPLGETELAAGKPGVVCPEQPHEVEPLGPVRLRRGRCRRRSPRQVSLLHLNRRTFGSREARTSRSRHAAAGPGAQAVTSLTRMEPIGAQSPSISKALTMVLVGRSGAISVTSRRWMPPSLPKTTRSSFKLSTASSLLFSMTKDNRHLFWTVSAAFNSIRTAFSGAALAAATKPSNAKPQHAAIFIVLPPMRSD